MKSDIEKIFFKLVVRSIKLEHLVINDKHEDKVQGEDINTLNTSSCRKTQGKNTDMI